NEFYLLPLLLGLAGLFFQWKRNGHDALIVGLLFFMTGLAIVVYLNQHAYQPGRGTTPMPPPSMLSASG
ncbi:MAG: hypothetical protein IH599_06885, partial [Bacteroidales bacterium]|nr:hypothetical protein [Bacteroidales bacterium]